MHHHQCILLTWTPPSPGGTKIIKPENGPLHIKLGVMHNALASAMEVNLVGLFVNFHSVDSIQTTLQELSHTHTTTLVITGNFSANGIVIG